MHWPNDNVNSYVSTWKILKNYVDLCTYLPRVFVHGMLYLLDEDQNS